MISVLGIILLVAYGLTTAQTDQPAKPDKEKILPEQESKKKYKKRKVSNPEIAIVTDFGVMEFELFRDVAPAHVDSMLARIRDGFYDGMIFHRLVKGKLLQGGDPRGNGSGNAGYFLPAEFSKLKHVEGTLSMARGPQPNTASCQFFICISPLPFLDGQYTIFGHLMAGYGVLHEIDKTVEIQGERPKKDIYIRKIEILKDIDAKKKN
jgi:peptidyl-prolyl cis-trans isomerase B (cyclophilin B)